jgi:hypothetical protein
MLPVSVAAQAPPAEEGASEARVHLGPLALDPRIALRNVGVDTNALNTAEPTRDLTATFGPELDSWLRIGRLYMAGESKLDWSYYRTLSGQRSFDAAQAGRADLALGYIIPHVFGGYERTRQRANLEVDARIPRTNLSFGGGLRVNLGPKLSVVASQEQRTIDFGDSQFGGVSLADTLNRTERETTVSARYALTPLTTLVFGAAQQRDRFEFSPIRDTDSLEVAPGVEFKPLALIAGSASVGFRQFEPTHDALPAFRGVVADVNLRYQAGELMRIEVGVDRNLEYSFEPLEPYYLSTGTSLTITQALGGAWDAVGRVMRTSLAYRALSGSADLVGLTGSRVDRVVVFGGGIGRRLASDVRVGLDIDRAERESTLSHRNYEGLRVGGSVTYGF